MPDYPLATLDALTRLASRGHRVSSVVDVGASDGQWSARASHVWPEAHYLLIEANALHRPALERFKQQAPSRIDYVIAAATDHVGQTIFHAAADPFGGTVSTPHPDAKIPLMPRQVPAITIDQLLGQRPLPKPHLIKLDTHGHELAILTGAAQTLRQTDVLVIEAYFHRINASAPLVHELCAFLADRGFGCIDMIDPLWRTYDQSLWQVDLVFIPLTSREFEYRAYA